MIAQRESIALYLSEPLLTFGYDQSLEDPRDGLTLFGPLDEGRPMGLRTGVIGTDRGIHCFRHWLKRVQQPLRDRGSEVARPPFPGFEAAFRIPWADTPVFELTVPEKDLLRVVNLDDRHQRVFETAALFAERLVDARRGEEIRPNVWFVVIPDVVWEQCRPRSRVPQQSKV